MLHRVAALGRALLIVGGLALSALGAGAQAHHAYAPEHDRAGRITQTTIESHQGLPADDVREGETVQLVSIELRSIVRPPVGNSSLANAAHAPADGHRADLLRWCDLIQCRRLGGALLLGFATPPPRIG